MRVNASENMLYQLKLYYRWNIINVDIKQRCIGMDEVYEYICIENSATALSDTGLLFEKSSIG